MELNGTHRIHREIARDLLKAQSRLAISLGELTGVVSGATKAEISLETLTEANELLTKSLQRLIESVPGEPTAPELSLVLHRLFEPLDPSPKNRAVNRAIHSLRERYGIRTYGDLLKKSHNDVRATKDVGPKGFTDLVAHLESLGLSLGKTGKSGAED